MEAIALDRWMAQNASKIRQIIGLDNPVDDDAFQDAYLTIAQEFTVRQERPSVFERAFLAAYRKIQSKNFSETFKTAHPDELFFTMLTDKESDPIEKPKRKEPRKSNLAKDINGFLTITFSSVQMMIWRMRKAGRSIRDTADAMGVSQREVKETQAMMTESVRLHFATTYKDTESWH